MPLPLQARVCDCAIVSAETLIPLTPKGLASRTSRAAGGFMVCGSVPEICGKHSREAFPLRQGVARWAEHEWPAMAYLRFYSSTWMTLVHWTPGKSRHDMQIISPRTNLGPVQGAESDDAKSGVEASIREFVRQDARNLRREPKDADDLKANVHSLVERASSLSELQTVIGELQRLHAFLHAEGERLQRDLSDYAQVSKAAMSSTRAIAENIRPWKKAADD